MAIFILISRQLRTIANPGKCSYASLNLLDDSTRLLLFQSNNELNLRSLHKLPKLNKKYNAKTNLNPINETSQFISNRQRKQEVFADHLQFEEEKRSQSTSRKKNTYKYSKPHEGSSHTLRQNTSKVFSVSQLNDNEENIDAVPIDDTTPPTLIYTEDPDSFGMLSRTNEQFNTKYENDEGDVKEEEFLRDIPLHKDKLSTKRYADLIKDHIQNKRIKEALNVLEKRMLKEDKVKPENYIYNLLIGGCARVGYTKKAFMLFNDLKKRGLKVTGGTYTSLFNACANSPWSEDGLHRARNLRLLMTEKGEEPNLTNYNSMIKAFGRCGDIHTAFSIADEMASKGIKIRVHTFNFLLQACISNKNSGFQHALIVWRKMLTKKEKPNMYSFNLMLKCVRECEYGDINGDLESIKAICFPGEPKSIQQIEDFSDLTCPKLMNDSDISQQCPSNLQNALEVASSPENSLSTRPLNLLTRHPDTSSIMSIKQIKTADDRLMMIGGYLGFLQEMNSYNLKPDTKTLTQLLIVAPNTIEADEKLLMIKNHLSIKVDIDFYNMLIKKRCFRLDYDSAKQVKQLIEEDNKLLSKKQFWKRKDALIPNIMTYGCMALYCVTKKDAEDLINEMTASRLRLNSEILGTLVRQGTANDDIDYVLFIMNYTKNENFEVNEIYCSHIEKFYIKCKAILRGEITLNGQPATPSFEASFKKFKKEFKKFMAQKKNVEDEHPWTQFRADQPATFQRPTIKPKAIRYYRRAPRRIPRYVVKT